MQEWLAIRRKGQDFSQSMVGQLIRGGRLEEMDLNEDDVDVGEGVGKDEVEDNGGDEIE